MPTQYAGAAGLIKIKEQQGLNRGVNLD